MSLVKLTKVTSMMMTFDHVLLIEGNGITKVISWISFGIDDIGRPDLECGA